ncbi:MAG: hypothetical protein K2F90_01300 [Clostridiales bacterium]|nr:hypothetical protein [Clostridiales bacterium]
MAEKSKSKLTAVTPEPTDKLMRNAYKSAIDDFVLNVDLNEHAQAYEELRNNAISVFRRECSVILNVDSPTYLFRGAVRQEAIKTYIIKTLLFVGTPPTGNGLAVLARLTEILTLHPELPLELVIEDFAKSHFATVDAVTRIIEKNFNVYDNYFCERVMALTGSHPMTAKDVLCDIGVYVRAKYMSQARA